jgi:DHA2 family multidrug resistance protein-like MFS transporter
MIISSAPAERAGNAAAISETALEAGVALGVAVLGSVVMGVFRHGLDVSSVPAAHAGAARESLGGAVETARALPESMAAELLDSARSAFVSGVHWAATGTTVILLLTAVMVYRAARSEDSGE